MTAQAAPLEGHKHKMSIYPGIFGKFLHFGMLAWGGPIAQIGMLRDELVEKEKWVNSAKFNWVLAVYQALPGPEAHELSVYMGMQKGGRLGGLLAGLGFMLPGLVLALLAAWWYGMVGAAALLPILAGAKPAVMALITRGCWRIGRQALTDFSLVASGIVAMMLAIAGVHFLLVFGLCLVWDILWRRNKKLIAVLVLLLAGEFLFFSGWEEGAHHLAQSRGDSQIPPLPINASWQDTLWLFYEGLKAGLLSFGGAYTAIPYLHASLVETQGVISNAVFVDAVAIASLIPAPLVMFATFLGYMAGGWTGAAAITAGIFLPAFAITLAGHKMVEKLVDNKRIERALHTIAAAVAGMLAGTMCKLFILTVSGWAGIFLFVAALFVLARYPSKWMAPAVIFASVPLWVALQSL